MAAGDKLKTCPAQDPLRYFMTPKRWEQINQLFHAALEREPQERLIFLKRACNGDEALRCEVESLLSSHERANSFIETPASDVAAELLAKGKGKSEDGKQIGRYQMTRLLGEGGMGEVYLAEDTGLGRPVALKLLPAQFTINAERVRRFEQEARAASSLNHPNIITIHEIGRESSRHFIATEFIDGVTLREYKARHTLTLTEVLDMAAQIASALSAAHEARIVHRDIKPENVMIRRDGLVKVLDFGLAKLIEQEALNVDTTAPTKAFVKTEEGAVMGTISYMSPEQARGAEHVDERTDIWSLGVVLYELVAGHLPFTGQTKNDAIAAILKTEPPLLSRYTPDVPAELERIVMKALRKDKAERYQVVKELALDLKSLKRRLEFEAELKRSGTSEEENRLAHASTIIEDVSAGTTEIAAAQTGAASNIHYSSSAEYIVSEIKQHKRGALFVLATLLLAISGLAAYFVYFSRSSSNATINSVAVLPFTNATGDANAEYISDGISESIINSLSQLPGMKVIARSSSFKYKGKEVDPQEVAKALGVQAILTGRVTQRGDTLLISVELVDARDKTHIWGEQYTRKVTDLLALQSEISEEIASKLRLRLNAGEQQQLAKRETVNPAAYELLLKGRYYSKKSTEQQKQAVEYFNQAIAIDPNYALAYAELSLTYGGLININVLDPKEFMPKAEMAAHKALELDESLAEAHLAMAQVKVNAWEWAAAEREYKRALELNPNLAGAHTGYAFYHNIMGRREEAIMEMRRARDLDPLAPGANRAVVYELSIRRQYPQALEASKKLLEEEPRNPNLHSLVGYQYMKNGLYREAIAEYLEAIKLGDDSRDTQILLGEAYAKAGEPEKTRAILKQLETGKEYVSPVGLASLYTALGEYDQAFALLERAYSAHDQQLIWLRVERSFESLRSDPRYQDLMRRVGLDK